VAHDPVDGMLIAHFIGPRAEDVPQRVEADAPSLEAQLPDKFAEFLAD
jgi:hypothetical protein